MPLFNVARHTFLLPALTEPAKVMLLTSFESLPVQVGENLAPGAEPALLSPLCLSVWVWVSFQKRKPS